MAVLKSEQSIPELLRIMTLEEKLKLLTGGSFFGTCAMEKYGIPTVRTVDGATGVSFMQAMMQEASEKYFEKHPDQECTMQMMGMLPGCKIASRLFVEKEIRLEEFSEEDQEFYKNFCDRHPEDPSSFPAGMMLGATWNPEVVQAVGQALGEEYRAFGYDVSLGPNVNIHRDPLNGRLFEGYSEDPVLVSALAPEFVKGLQSTGVLACVKHFAANNQETFRNNGEEHISLQALYDIYFPGFRACIQEGKSASIMSAYNKINGTPCAHNAWLLKDVLRDEWKYDGVVISDWGAVYNKVAGIKGGNDIEMPSNTVIASAVEAMENGDLTMEEIDRAVTHVLRFILKSLAFRGRKTGCFDDEKSRRAAYQAAVEGSVLLKNDGILPLKEGAKVACIGKLCAGFMDCGAGSAKVVTRKTSSMVETLKEGLGTENVVQGITDSDVSAYIITVGSRGQEGSDRRRMDLEEEDKTLLLETVREAREKDIPVIVVLNVAGPVEMDEWLEDVSAVLCVFIPGREGAHAAGDILLGRVNPSGKLPLTFPKHYADCPSAINFPGYNEESWYGEGIYVGYRYYDYKKIKPLFAFGYGISYTEFTIDGLRMFKGEVDLEKNEPLRFSVRVANTGKLAGSEVVQVYVSQKKPGIPKALKELKAFRKIYLQAGESRETDFEIYPDQLAVYDVKTKEYVTETGEYQILIGNAADNILFIKDFIVSGPDMGLLNENTPLSAVARSNSGMIRFMTAIRSSGCVVETAEFLEKARTEPDMTVMEYLNDTLDISMFVSSEEARRNCINYIVKEIAGTPL